MGTLNKDFGSVTSYILGCCTDIHFLIYKADRKFMGGNKQVFNTNGIFRPLSGLKLFCLFSKSKQKQRYGCKYAIGTKH